MTDSTEAQHAATPPAAQQATSIELDTPLQRGKTSVTSITVRKPLGGALRGIALVDLLNMDTRSLQKVLPRITEPALSEVECRDLDPADLLQLGTAVSTFLLGKRADSQG